jgi:uncharacterized protein YcbK (DUF882 family)
MKKTILAGLSVLTLSTSAVPALAHDYSSVSKADQTTINKQYVDPQDNREYQAAVEELNQMFEKHRQEMMAEMDRQLTEMHDEMMRVINERFRKVQDQRLNRH